jgi:hypothetical protein
MSYITLPRFYCPFPAQMNPLAEKVDEHTFTWATEFQLLQKEAAIQRFHKSRFAWLAARAYPGADFAELALANDFFTWLFMLDDQFDDGSLGRQPERLRAVIGGLLAILGFEQAGNYPALSGPLANALTELWDRILPLTTPQWQKRFTRHLLAYFDSYNWETCNRAAGTIPDVEIYIDKRQDAGAMRIALDYIDLAAHIDLPAEVYSSSLVQTLLRITNNAVCWANDIISLEKEIARGDLNNLVLALQAAHACTLQEAVLQANEMLTREVQLFTHLAPLLTDAFPVYEQDLQKYLISMQGWIRGNLDWSVETDRYKFVEVSAPGQSVSYLEAILPLDL